MTDSSIHWTETPQFKTIITRLDEMGDSVDRMSNDFTDSFEGVKRHDADIQKHEKTLGEHKKFIKNLAKANENLKNSTTTKAEFDDRATIVDNRFNDLDNTITILTGRLDTDDSEIDSLKSRNTQLEVRADAVEEENRQLEERVAALETQLQEMLQQMQTLAKQQSKSHQKIQHLDKRITETDANIRTDLEASIQTAIATEDESIKAVIASDREEIEKEIQQLKEQLEDQVTKAEERVNDFENTAKNLEQTANDITDRINYLQGDDRSTISDLRSRINRLSEDLSQQNAGTAAIIQENIQKLEANSEKHLRDFEVHIEEVEKKAQRSDEAIKESLTTSIATLRAELTTIQETQKNDKASTEQQITQLVDVDLKQIQATQETQSQTLEEMTTKLQDLDAQHKDDKAGFDQSYSELKAELDDVKKDIGENAKNNKKEIQTITKLISAQKEEIQTENDSKLQDLQKQNAETIQTLNQKIEEGNQNFTQKTLELSGQIKHLEDTSIASKDSNEQFEPKIVELQNDVRKLSSLIEPMKSKEGYTLDTIVKMIETEGTAHEKKVDDLRIEIQEEIEGIKGDNQATRQEFSEQNAQLQDSVKTLDQKTTDQLNQLKKSREEQIKKLTKQIEEVGNSIPVEVSKVTGGVSETIKDIKDAVQDLQNLLNTTAGRLDESDSQLNEHIKQNKDKIKKLQKDLKEVADKLEERDDKIEKQFKQASIECSDVRKDLKIEADIVKKELEQSIAEIKEEITHQVGDIEKLCQQIDSSKAAFDEQFNISNSKMEDIESKVKESESNLSAVKEDLKSIKDSDMQSLVQSIDSNIKDNLSNVNEQHKTLLDKIETLEQQMNDKTASIQTDFNSKVQDVLKQVSKENSKTKKEHDDKASDISQQISEINKALDTIQNSTLHSHSSEIKSLKKLCNRLTDSLNEQKTQTTESITQNKEELDESMKNRISELKTEFDSIVTRLHQQIASLEGNEPNYALKKDIDCLEQKIRSVQGDDNANLPELIAEVTHLKTSIDGRLAKIDQMSTQIDSFNTSFKQSISELKGGSDKSIAEIQTDLQLLSQELTQNRDQTTASFTNVSNELHTQYKDLVDMLNQHKQETSEMNRGVTEKISKLKGELAENTTTTSRSLTELREDFEQKATTLSKSIDAMDQNATSQLASHTTQLETIQQLIASKHQSIKDQLEQNTTQLRSDLDLTMQGLEETQKDTNELKFAIGDLRNNFACEIKTSCSKVKEHVTKDFDDKLKEEKKKLNKNIESVQKSLGELTGGEGSQSIASLALSIEGLKSQLEHTNEHLIDTITTNDKDIKAKIQEHDEQLVKLDSEFKKSTKDLDDAITLKHQSIEKKLQLQKNQTEMTLADQKTELMNQITQSSNDVLAEATKMSSKNGSKISELATRIDQHDDAIAKLNLSIKAEADSTKQSVDALIQEANKEFTDKNENMLKVLKAAQEEAEEQIKQSENTIQSTVSQLQAQIESQGQEIEQLDASQKEMRKDIKAINKSLKETQLDIQKDNDSFNSQIKDLQASTTANEVSIQQIGTQAQGYLKELENHIQLSEAHFKETEDLISTKSERNKQLIEETRNDLEEVLRRRIEVFEKSTNNAIDAKLTESSNKFEKTRLKMKDNFDSIERVVLGSDARFERIEENQRKANDQMEKIIDRQREIVDASENTRSIVKQELDGIVQTQEKNNAQQRDEIKRINGVVNENAAEVEKIGSSLEDVAKQATSDISRIDGSLREYKVVVDNVEHVIQLMQPFLTFNADFEAFNQRFEDVLDQMQSLQTNAFSRLFNSFQDETIPYTPPKETSTTITLHKNGQDIGLEALKAFKTVQKVTIVVPPDIHNVKWDQPLVLMPCQELSVISKNPERNIYMKGSHKVGGFVSPTRVIVDATSSLKIAGLKIVARCDSDEEQLMDQRALFVARSVRSKGVGSIAISRSNVETDVPLVNVGRSGHASIKLDHVDIGCTSDVSLTFAPVTADSGAYPVGYGSVDINKVNLTTSNVEWVPHPNLSQPFISQKKRR